MSSMANDHPLPSPETQFTADHQPLLRGHKPRKQSQIADMQYEAYSFVMCPMTDLRDKAALMCAWERLENRLARMTMRPEPKPIDVSVESSRGRRLADKLKLSDSDPSA